MTLKEKKEKYPNLYALAVELASHKNGYSIAESIIKHRTNNGNENVRVSCGNVLVGADESTGD